MEMCRKLMKCCVYVIILYFASRTFLLRRLDFHQLIIPIIVNNSNGPILDRNTSENSSKINTTGTKKSKQLGRGKIINHVICSISFSSYIIMVGITQVVNPVLPSKRKSSCKQDQSLSIC